MWNSTFYLPEVQAVFLHIPRTGGSWVKKTIVDAGIPYELWGDEVKHRRGGRKHTILGHIKHEYMPRVKQAFCFVRHPVDWYPSLWAMAKNLRESKGREFVKWRMRWEYTKCWEDDFEVWAWRMLDENPCYATRIFEQFVGPEGMEFCNFVGRTETLVDDLERRLKDWGYSVDLTPHKQPFNAVSKPEVPLGLQNAICRGERIAIRRFYGDWRKRRYSGEEDETSRENGG